MEKDKSLSYSSYLSQGKIIPEQKNQTKFIKKKGRNVAINNSDPEMKLEKESAGDPRVSSCKLRHKSIDIK